MLAKPISGSVAGPEPEFSQFQAYIEVRLWQFVPREAYKPTFWPRFCSGGLVIESADNLPKLVAALEKRERYISVRIAN
ncbi:unnamed protein product, partial [Mesorhabditis belari]|uniref:Uncharacterized protein n=1 Tax=Mesorhabditis belari TaxID=2138241 RepID=A0AAF3J504_9BILA